MEKRQQVARIKTPKNQLDILHQSADNKTRTLGQFTGYLFDCLFKVCLLVMDQHATVVIGLHEMVKKKEANFHYFDGYCDLICA